MHLCGSIFFGVALDFIPKNKLETILDNFTQVNSYYLHSNSIEIDGKVFEYQASYNNFYYRDMGIFIDNVSAIKKSTQNDSNYLVAHLADNAKLETLTDSIFDIFKTKEKL